MTAAPVTDIQLLHVEDNELDAMAVRRAFDKLDLCFALDWARDGVEALDKLQGTTDPQQGAVPTVILLDINMPRMNGHEFLQQLRENPALRHTPVFVLTTSDQPSDIRKAYDKNVAGYIVKPVGLGLLHDRLKQWSEFLNAIELPAPAPPV